MRARITAILSIVSLLVITLSGSVMTATALASSAAPPTNIAATTIYIPVVDKDRAVQLTLSTSPTLTAFDVSSSLPLGTGSPGSSAGSTSTTYTPQPGDSSLIRDKVFMDFSKSRVITTSSSPLSASAYLVGNLPDPCHLLRITKSTTAGANIVSIQVYSLVKAGTLCVTVLKPFAVTYPLGTFSAGLYTVMVNGTRLGTFGNIALSNSTP